MVMPETVTGKPARSRPWRAMLPPVVPCCRAQPMTMSSTSAGVDAGALDGLRQRVADQRLALGVVEGAAIGLADRRARGGDDDCFTHEMPRLSEESG